MNSLFSNLPLLLGAPEAGAASGGSSGQLVTTVVTFGLVILIFYFLIIRPQNKKQKQTKNMLSALKKGDKVVTIGGIRGVVQSVKEDVVIIKVDDNIKLEFNKSAMASVLEQKETKEDKDTKKGKEEK